MRVSLERGLGAALRAGSGGPSVGWAALALAPASGVVRLRSRSRSGSLAFGQPGESGLRSGSVAERGDLGRGSPGASLGVPCDGETNDGMVA